jgi:hypothetical protein
LTFSGAAVAFIVTAEEKLHFNIAPKDLRWVLLSWGLTIFFGFTVYILSYREVWYYEECPDTTWKKVIFWPEYVTLYAALIIHPVAMLLSIALTVLRLWENTPRCQEVSDTICGLGP